MVIMHTLTVSPRVPSRIVVPITVVLMVIVMTVAVVFGIILLCCFRNLIVSKCKCWKKGIAICN